ncbi:hypothetical protein F4V57_13860 [Acinetobacter qingfengensis]|uniref:Uncharacterized protein n=1 Tax=Acinetobacter qingfengensis TaxID=1262585 RepID=A0A1E7REK2_9GAMM|nr:hypothetical protein [Acinetobacter qingfengensis]KAA8731163.1 hypothetical protein F4V57_13860 [Acinetobacter qingfengensis]OEY97830.1 hypothetical protein BJI46_07995 [Acinetobacter qingfengensis]
MSFLKNLGKELKQITDEFEQSENLQNFIFKYEPFEHEQVQILVAKAYLMVLSDSCEYPEENFSSEYFIQHFKQHTVLEIQLIVLQAMLIRLKQHANEKRAQFNDWYNELIEYAEQFSQDNYQVIDTLIEVYSYKAQNLSGKDPFKVHYFYHKIIQLSKKNLSNENYELVFQAEQKIFQFYLSRQQLSAFKQSYYAINAHYLSNHQTDITSALKQNTAIFLQFWLDVQKDQNPFLHPEIRQFLQYLHIQDDLKNLILQPENQRQYQFIFELCYLFWLIQYEEISEKYWFVLLKYHQTLQDYQSLIDSFWFDQPQRRHGFQSFLIDSTDKYHSLNKYRKMFNTSLGKNNL